MNINHFRNQFPYLDTETIYFNHAALGPISSIVLSKINEFLEERSVSNVMNYDSFLPVNKNAKKKIARLLNTDASRIAWSDNVSNAMNLIAQGFKWERGDKIILNDVEFPANVYPFMNLEKYGVEIDFVKSKNRIVTVEDIESLISPRTKLISISLVQFLSGYRIDVDALGELCSQKNIILCVDAIQGAGTVQIDIKKSQIDFLAGGAQKWMMGLQGLSYVYVSEKLQDMIDQKYVGWISVKNAWNLLDYKLQLRNSADRYQNGTQNAIGIIALNASLDCFESFGYDKIEIHILNNTQYFLNSLKEIGIKTVLEGSDKNTFSGIVSFEIENEQELFDKMNEMKIICSLREGVIRMSPHFYNTYGEIDRVVDEIKNFISL